MGDRIEPAPRQGWRPVGTLRVRILHGGETAPVILSLSRGHVPGGVAPWHDGTSVSPVAFVAASLPSLSAPRTVARRQSVPRVWAIFTGRARPIRAAISPRLAYAPYRGDVTS